MPDRWKISDRCEVRPVPGSGPVDFGGPEWWFATVTAVRDEGAGQRVTVLLDAGSGNEMDADTDVPPGWERIRPTDIERRRRAALDALIANGWISADERDRYADMARAMVEVVHDQDGGAAEILLILGRSGIPIRGRGAQNALAVVHAILAGEHRA